MVGHRLSLDTCVSGELFAETFKILDHMVFLANTLAFHWVT